MITSAYLLPHPPIALPEIGKGEEKKCALTIHGYEICAARIAAQKPDVLLVVSPHAVLFRDWFNISSGTKAYGDFEKFGIPELSMEVNYDTEFVSEMERLKERDFPVGTEYDRDVFLDHGTMVPLYYIRKRLPDCPIVRISLSGFSLVKHYELGILLEKTAEKLHRNAVLIASGDLSHCRKEDGAYGYRPEGEEYDRRVMEDIRTGSFGNLLRYSSKFLHTAMECGHRSVTILAGAFDGRDVKTEIFSHEAPFGVGYGTAEILGMGEDTDRCFLNQYNEQEEKEAEERYRSGDVYVRLAVDTIRACCERRRLPVVPEALRHEKAGVFVSIQEDGELRGCIGTILPYYGSIGEEIVQNAVSACNRDPRFTPIVPEELSHLKVSVDVLSEPEVIGGREDLDVKRFGVICSTKDGRRGLLLPDLEGVDTVEEQLRIACSKGGIDLDMDTVLLERFEVIRHV